MKYVNEYTVGGASVAALTAAGVYFSKAAVLTVPHVAGIALLSTAAVAGTYAAFLGAKAVYNYFTASTEAAKTEDKKTEDNKPVSERQKRLDARNAKKAEAEAAKNKANAKAEEGMFASIKNRFSSAVNSVKGWFSSEEKAEEAKKDAPKADEAKKDAPKADEAKKDAPKADEAKKDAPKAAAKKVAPKAAAKKAVAKPATPKKAVTPAFTAKKAAAKKAAAKPAATVAPAVRRSPRLAKA